MCDYNNQYYYYYNNNNNYIKHAHVHVRLGLIIIHFMVYLIMYKYPIYS